MKKAIITIGNSASGKSEFINNYHNQDYRIIDPDFYISDKSHKQKQDSCKGVIEFCISKCLNVIIMATGGSQEIIKTLDYLKENNYYITIFHFNTPFEICVERNNNRDRKVSLDAMKKINENIEINLPTLKEKADRFYEIKNY